MDILVKLGFVYIACLFSCAQSEKNWGHNQQELTGKGTVVKECRCLDGPALIAQTDYVPNYDSLSLLGFYPTNQILKIDNQGEMRTVGAIGFMKRKVETGEGAIEVLNTAFTEAKCIGSDGSLIYSVYGIGLTDPPHEFFGLLSEQGKWLWYYYGNQHDVYGQYGNRDSLASVFGEENISEIADMTPLLHSHKQ